MKRVVILVLLAVVASACGSDEESAIVVYSGRTENLVGPLFETFTAETGIGVEVRYAPSTDLALLIEQEGDKSPADVFLSQSPGAVGLLAGQGLLAPLLPETLDLVAEEHRSAAGLWVGISGRVRVLVYNTDQASEEELPTSVFALTDPAYRSRVAVAPANGSFQDFVTGLREIHGDEVALQWLKDMNANDAPTYANNNAIVQAVGRGEVDMGLVNHYYNIRALAEDPSLGSQNHFFQDAGSLVIITAAGVLSGSDNSDNAEALLRYLLEREAQDFFFKETFEYPLAIAASAAGELTTLEDIGATTHSFDRLSGGLARTKELIDASGLEAP